MKTIIDNASTLPGILPAHCFKLENCVVKMNQCSDQINENVVTDESSINDDSASAQIGSFVTISWEFQTSKFILKISSRYIEDAVMLVISKQRFKICSNGKSIVS